MKPLSLDEARKLGLIGGKPTPKRKPKRSQAERVIAFIKPEVRCSPGAFCLRVPIELVSEANKRGHWAIADKRNDLQQEAVRALANVTHPSLRPPPPSVGGWRMRFCRIAPCELDPGNLGTSFKNVQDAICVWLGVKNERDRRYLSWAFEQRSEGARLYGCEIEITWEVRQ